MAGDQIWPGGTLPVHDWFLLFVYIQREDFPMKCVGYCCNSEYLHGSTGGISQGELCSSLAEAHEELEQPLRAFCCWSLAM